MKACRFFYVQAGFAGNLFKSENMYIYNITFVIAPYMKENFLGWIRTEALPLLFPSEGSACNPRLQTVVEAGGEKPGPEHGLSIALQAEFYTEKEAHDWHDIRLPEVLGRFNAKFGPHAAFFITLMEVLSYE